MENPQESVGRFVTHMVHDVKNPLTGIQGYLQLIRQLASSATDPRLEKYSAKALQGCLEMNEFLSNLSDILKIVDGRIKPDPTEVDLVPVLNNIVARLDHKMNETQLILNGHTPPIRLQSDARLLERVLHNLLLYSAGTVPARSEIILHAEERSDGNGVRVGIVIEDSGDPFSEPLVEMVRKHAGEFRVDEEEMTCDPGFAIHYAAIVLHRLGGKLTLSNLAPGKKFTVELNSRKL